MVDWLFLLPVIRCLDSAAERELVILLLTLE